MTQQVVTTTPQNSGNGDNAPTAFNKVNANFTELYGAFPGGVVGQAPGYSTLAPTTPAAGALWLSGSVRTLQVSSALADRTTMLTGAAGGFENGFCQEPSVFYNSTAGNWGMVYGGTTGLGYATASSPTGPWTKRGKILGGGTGGFAGSVSHSRAVIVNGLLYITFPDFTNSRFMITNGVAFPSGTSAPVFTSNSVIFTPNTGGLGITATLMGNSRIVLAGSTWYLFWEAFKTGVGWQIGTATSTTFNGTYTVGTYPLTTLQTVSATANACGGPMPLYENGAFVLYYHSGGGPSTKIYRAFSTDATNNWTIDNNGQPWLDMKLPNEVSQVADINIVSDGNGAYYAYWDAINNNTNVGAGAINGAPVILPTYVYDSTSSSWTQMGGMPKTQPNEFNYLLTGSRYTTSVSIANQELAVFDPQTAAANLTATLPYADIGSRCRIVNASASGTFTVTVAAQATDALTQAAPTIGVGQYVDYYCWLPNNWTRQIGINNYGNTTFPSGAALSFNGLLQILSGGFLTVNSGGTQQILSGGILELMGNVTGPANNLLMSGTAPTIGSGFGTSPSISQQNGCTSFSVNVGTGGTASSGVITLPAAVHGWSCYASDVGTTPTGRTEPTAMTTTSVTLTNFSRTTGAALAWTSGEVIQVSCFAN